MRILKFFLIAVFVAVALSTGFVAAAIAAIIAALYFGVRALLPKSPANLSSSPNVTRQNGPTRHRTQPPGSGDVIDITATEVPTRR